MIALAYIEIDVINTLDEMEAEILGQRYRARMIANSPYDPGNLVQR